MTKSLVLFLLLSVFTFASEPAPSVRDVDESIRKSMEYLSGQEGSGGGPQYNDYVVFCSPPVVKEYPQYAEIVEPYKLWIAIHDKFSEKLPYQSSCHVMALDIIGEREKAVKIFSQLSQFANDGKWLVSYHLGWDLYGCIVAEDKELLEKTLVHVGELHPHRYNHFVAYCLWKAYEKTGEGKYREMFLEFVDTLKQFQEQYFQMADEDGHAGMVLSVFCLAFHCTQDETYRDIARILAARLVASQSENGSWNDKTAYTIMPAEGLTHYLKFCP